jgi:cbb3-type cytochrome oxidase subunit 3
MRQFLEHATGLSIYPTISFVMFSLFFLGVLVWVFTRDSGYLSAMKNLPLDDENQNPKNFNA